MSEVHLILSAGVALTVFMAGDVISRVLSLPAWTPRIFDWARSWVLGACAVGIQGILFSALGLPFQIATLSLWWIPWLFALGRSLAPRRGVNADRRKTRTAERNEPMTPATGFMLGGLFLVGTSLSGWLAIQRPIYASDAAFIYGLNARVFEQAQGISLEGLRTLKMAGHIEYPPLFPLLESLFFQAGGEWGAYSAMMIPWLFGACLMLGAFYWARQRLGTQWAVAVVTLVCLTPEVLHFCRRGFAEIPLATLWLYALIHLDRLRREPSPGTAYGLGLLLGGCALIKNEGFALCLLLGLAVSPFVISHWRKGLGGTLRRVLLVSIPLVVMWPLWRKVVGLEVVDLVDTDPTRLLSLSRLGDILRTYFEMVTRKNPDGVWMWGLLWGVVALMAALTLIALRRGHGGSRASLWALLLWAGHTGLYLMVLGSTGHDLDWQLRTALPRLLVHTVPTALFFLVLSLDEWGMGSQKSRAMVSKA